MKTLISTKDLPREEWLQWRKKGIGGSDAATILGLNPFSSQLALYADKLGLLPEKEDSESMRIGRDLEQYVAERFCDATGKKVRHLNVMLVHPEHEFMIVNLDRVVVGENVPLECKVTSAHNKHDFENGEIPPYFYVQVQHECAVYGSSYGYLAVLVLGKGFYWFRIDAVPNEQAALIESERKFWHDHVLTKVMPDPDGSESAYAAVQALTSPKNEPVGEALLYDMDKDIQHMLNLQDQIKPVQQAIDSIKQRIALSMGQNAYGISNVAKVSYLTQYRKEHMVKASVSRVLRVTALKGEK